eukprot:jgi/Tetstr1/423476/TSEL_014157.t1
MATRVRLASALSSPLLFGAVGQQVAAPAWSASACAATLLAARRGLARVSPASIPAPACTGVGAAAAREAARWASTSAGRAAVSGQVGAAATAAASTGAAAAAGRSVLARARELLGDYKQLSKLRLSLLVVSTASGGYVLGSPEEVDWAGLCWVSLGTLGAAASANTLNQIYEIKLDGLMKRTRNRPLPSGRISRGHALAFALVTGLGSTALLAAKTNTLTAQLGAANIFLYAGIYTPLKTVSIVNTWVGALVGAVPPLMGWAAAAGGLSLGAAALGAVLYWWQMPHFMALAWMCKADYGAGGYRMLSLVDPTGQRTAACALRNCVYLMPLGILAVCLGVTTDAFAFENAIISGGMAATAAAFYQTPSQAAARTLFRASLLHLPLIMTAMMVHRLPNSAPSSAELLQRLRERFEPKEAPTERAGSQHDAGALGFPMPVPFPFLPLPTAASVSHYTERQPLRPAQPPSS